MPNPMSLSFLGKKSFHPSNPKNVAKLFAAEQKLEHEAKRAEELKHEAEQEEARRQARALLGKGAEPESVPSAISFMYQKPPGMAEAQSRHERKERDDAQKTKAELDAERFPILKNAPREGEYTNNIDVQHKPFALHLRKVQCKRCLQWGHSLGDRECPLRDTPDPKDEQQKAREDPISRAAGTEASGGALRWAPKAAPDAGLVGGASTSDHNQQFVAMVDEGMEATVGGSDALMGAAGAGMEELDPAVLAMLTEKQRRKLLKMYQRELSQLEGGAHDSAVDEVGDTRKRKKHHHQKEAKHHKDKRHKDTGKHSDKSKKRSHGKHSKRDEDESGDDSSGSGR